MNNNVCDASGNVLGYYFYCELSKAYIAVKSTGERATAARAFNARHFIEN